MKVTGFNLRLVSFAGFWSVSKLLFSPARLNTLCPVSLELSAPVLSVVLYNSRGITLVLSLWLASGSLDSLCCINIVLTATTIWVCHFCVCLLFDCMFVLCVGYDVYVCVCLHTNSVWVMSVLCHLVVSFQWFVHIREYFLKWVSFRGKDLASL